MEQFERWQAWTGGVSREDQAVLWLGMGIVEARFYSRYERLWLSVESTAETLQNAALTVGTATVRVGWRPPLSGALRNHLALRVADCFASLRAPWMKGFGVQPAYTIPRQPYACGYWAWGRPSLHIIIRTSSLRDRGSWRSHDLCVAQAALRFGGRSASLISLETNPPRTPMRSKTIGLRKNSPKYTNSTEPAPTAISCGSTARAET